MKKILLPLMIAMLLISSTVPVAYAHKVSIWAYVEGKVLEGQVYFPDGSPAKKTAVTLFDPAGKECGKTTTADDGTFSLMLPQGFTKGHLKAEASMGHMAEIEVTVESDNGEPEQEQTQESVASVQKDTAASSAASNDEIARVVRDEIRKELAPIKKDVARMANRGVGFQDVLGGLGYIIGIGSLMLLLKERRHSRS
ncbi:MAG: hypothetical protein STSR0007_02450 [Thermovirga sp.]